MPHSSEIYYSKGNSKVKFPIINLQSGTDCACAGWCLFSKQNHKRAGKRLCYAQKTERIYPSVLQSRRTNQRIIDNMPMDTMADVVPSLACKLAKHATDKIVRFNESGDLSDANIAFICMLSIELRKHGVRMYGYSKSSNKLVGMLRATGATVLRSQKDFIAYGTEEAGKASGMVQCPGVCGPCKRCPQGKQSWILEH